MPAPGSQAQSSPGPTRYGHRQGVGQCGPLAAESRAELVMGEDAGRRAGKFTHHRIRRRGAGIVELKVQLSQFTGEIEAVAEVHLCTKRSEIVRSAPGIDPIGFARLDGVVSRHLGPLAGSIETVNLL